MGKSALIKLKKIRKQFGKKLVLDNINLNVYEGEIIGIVGKSGIGKTTLLRIMVGFLEPDDGEVLFKQKPFFRSSLILNKSGHFKYFGFSTQEKSFYSRLTVKENLAYFASLYGLPKSDLDRNIDTVLKCVGLKDEKDTLSKTLSEGMQKRLDIACSILHNPKVLIVDEPTADLDPVLRKQIWSLIKTLNFNGKKTIIVSSHILQELFPVCDKIFFLRNQRLKMINKKQDISKLYGTFANEETDLIAKSGW